METAYLVFTYILTGLLGLCIGSFLNVVIYRVPLGMSVVYPPSHCPKCDYKLKWYDNIPVLSYCLLGGKCRGCGEHISFRYTVVELANMLLWLASVFLFFSFDAYGIIKTVCVMVLSSVLICVFFIDLEHKIIPDRFSVILAVLGVILTVSDALLTDGRWTDHLIGFAVGGGFFLLIYYLALWIYKREGLGFGDVKLMAAAGTLSRLDRNFYRRFGRLRGRLRHPFDHQTPKRVGAFYGISVCTVSCVRNPYSGAFRRRADLLVSRTSVILKIRAVAAGKEFLFSDAKIQIYRDQFR